MAISHTRKFWIWSFVMPEFRETQHLSSMQLFRQQPTKVFPCPWKSSSFGISTFWHCWWLLHSKFCVFLVSRFMAFFHKKYAQSIVLLLACSFPFAEICWTVDHRPPFPVFLLHSRPKQPIFLEQAPTWIVRWGWMARETARLENLPQTSGNFRLARWQDGKTQLWPFFL